MSPRPQKVSDDEILAAAYRAMNRFGPGELTLSAIAQEAGVTAGLLVQRFGSKRDLLLTLARRAAEGSGDFIQQIRKASPSPLVAIRTYTDCVAQLAASPAAFVRSLAYLQIDLTDADFRKHLLVQTRATRAGLEDMVRDAITAGEIRSDVNAHVLARTLEALIGGSMFSWAFYREGTAAEWMRADVDAVLAPYLVKPRATRRKPSSQRRRT